MPFMEKSLVLIYSIIIEDKYIVKIIPQDNGTNNTLFANTDGEKMPQRTFSISAWQWKIYDANDKPDKNTIILRDKCLVILICQKARNKNMAWK